MAVFKYLLGYVIYKLNIGLRNVMESKLFQDIFYQGDCEARLLFSTLGVIALTWNDYQVFESRNLESLFLQVPCTVYSLQGTHGCH